MVTGRGLWLQVSNVIILHENMRQRDDPRYFELLQRLRLGQCPERLGPPLYPRYQPSGVRQGRSRWTVAYASRKLCCVSVCATDRRAEHYSCVTQRGLRTHPRKTLRRAGDLGGSS